MISERDLAFVAPEKRAEVLRRIGLVERFLEKPGRKMADACAAELGMSAAMFYNLVKAWKLQRRPEAISGAGRPRHKPSSISTAQAAVIADAGEPGAGPADVVRRALAIGAERGIDMPNTHNIERHWDRTRPRRLPAAFGTTDDGIVIDACAVRMAVDAGNGLIVRPIMTAVLDVARSRMAGLSLSIERFDASTAAAALLDALASTTIDAQPVGLASTSLRYWQPGGQDWSGLERHVEAAGFMPHVLDLDHKGHGRAITGLLGLRKAGVDLQPRLALTDVARRGIGSGSGQGLGEAMDLRTATELLRGRFVGQARPPFFANLDDVDRTILADGLTVLTVTNGRPGDADDR